MKERQGALQNRIKSDWKEMQLKKEVVEEERRTCSHNKIKTTTGRR